MCLPSNVSLPPTIDKPRPIGFPSSSLSLVISIAVSAPGVISQFAGLALSESSVEEPGPLRLGEATGFFVLLAAGGGCGAVALTGSGFFTGVMALTSEGGGVSTTDVV